MYQCQIVDNEYPMPTPGGLHRSLQSFLRAIGDRHHDRLSLFL